MEPSPVKGQAMRFRAKVASSFGIVESPLSTKAMIRDTGMLEGEGAKVRPFLRTSFSNSVRGLLDRFTTHLSWTSELCVTERYCDSNLDFCLNLHLAVSMARARSFNDASDLASSSNNKLAKIRC